MSFPKPCGPTWAASRSSLHELGFIKSRILISNDDGIHAPGIKALERIARLISKDVWVVAPETEQSAAGHSLTIRRPSGFANMERDISWMGHHRRRLAGVNTIIKGKKPDLVLSGI